MFESGQRKLKQNQASRIFFTIITIMSVSLDQVHQCHCKPNQATWNDARDCSSKLESDGSAPKPSRLDASEADLLQIEAPQAATKTSEPSNLLEPQSSSHTRRLGRSIGALEIAEARDLDSSLLPTELPMMASSRSQQLELTRRLELPTRRQFHDAINDDENDREWRKSLEEASAANEPDVEHLSAADAGASDKLGPNEDDEFEPDASNLDMTFDLHPAAQHHSYGSHYGSLNKHHGKYYQ